MRDASRVHQLSRMEINSEPGAFTTGDCSTVNLPNTNLPSTKLPRPACSSLKIWKDMETGNLINKLQASYKVNRKFGTEDVKLRAGSDDRSNMGDKYLGGGLVMGDVSSRVSSSVLSTDINLSSSLGSGSSDHGAFAALPSDVFMKDKFTDKVEPTPRYKVSEPGKIQHYGKHESFQSMKDACTEVIPAVQHRDMGTYMTPLGSSRTSRCHTPVKAGSPARHNTPASRSALINSAGIDIGELEKCHFANLELQGLPSGIQFNSVDKSVSTWSSREEEEEEVSKSLRHFDMGDCKKSIVEIRAADWEEAERSKCFTR